MSENVERVDFGKDQRESARKLSRLLGMLAERDAEMLANPKKYFDLAAEEVIRLRRIIQAAQEAMDETFSLLEPVNTRQDPMDTVMVYRADYERLRAMSAIIMAEDC